MTDMGSPLDLGHWEYSGPDFDPDDFFGFVYVLTWDDGQTRRYVGKKQFHSYKKRKRDKGSNWKTYRSSSKHLAELHKEFGDEYFKYDMLQLFETRGGLTAGECKVQWDLDVLTEKYPDDTPVYMNRQIGAVKFIPKESITDETKDRLEQIKLETKQAKCTDDATEEPE